MESSPTPPRTPALLFIGIVQLLIGTVMLTGRILGLYADRKIQGNIDVAATLASGAIIIGLYFFSNRKPLLSAVASLLVYAAVVGVYISEISGTFFTFPNGDWGDWLGWINLAIFFILIQTLFARRKSPEVAK